jgi:DNA-binding MarR family transcriptional regulator
MKPGAQADLDDLWKTLVTMVMDSRTDWRRKVAEVTGLPFSRVRALRRLGERPLTLGELAESMGSDAPAATVAVNDLEKRGLVERHAHPHDRRAKVVSLTAAGKQTLRELRRVRDAAPASFASLTPQEVLQLSKILERVR